MLGHIPTVASVKIVEKGWPPYLMIKTKIIQKCSLQKLLAVLVIGTFAASL